MSRASFFDLVINTRYNQKMYYATRDRGYARDAREYEYRLKGEISAGQAWIDANPQLAQQQGSRLSFFRLVKQMCYNQQQWYDTHDRQYLLASIELEKRVDAEIPNEYAQLDIADQRYNRYIKALSS